MDTAEFVAEVARKASITRAEAARAVDAVFNAESGAISEALEETGEFSVAGFGKFTKTNSAAGASTKGKSKSGFAVSNGVSPSQRDPKRHTITLKGRGGRRDITITIDVPEDVIHPLSLKLYDSESESEISALATKVWENPDDAEEFLTTPHGLLGGQTPLAASRTHEGAARVREILLALEYGLPV